MSPPNRPTGCLDSLHAALLLALAAACPLARAAPPLAAPAPAAVELFSPAGEVRQVHQVSVRFTAPMVALGDPRLPDPFVAQCAAPGQGRWADARNWVYDFEQDLPAGLRCAFTLRKGAKSLAGAALSGRRRFEFTTGGPAVIASFPREGWEEIDEEQVFLLRLDAEATDASIRAHARCVVQGLEEQIPVELLTGETRAAVLRERQALGYEYFQLLWKSGRTSNLRVRERSLERAEARIAVLRCQRRLPPATRGVLRWAAGIRSTSAIATTQDQALAFRVRPAFTARVECSRTNARAGCLPMQPINVMFSAPVANGLALGTRLRLADGTELRPVQTALPQGATVESVSFPGPFPDARPVSVLLVAGLTDDAGRPLENAARFPLMLRIDRYPPLAKFSGRFGILELHEGGILPVTLRNVEPALAASESALPARLLRLDHGPAEIARWLRRVEEAGAERGEWEEIPAQSRTDPPSPKPQLGTLEAGEEDSEDGAPRHRWRENTGTTSVFTSADLTSTFPVTKPSGARASEVIGIPLKAAGFYVVEIESRVLGRSLLGRDQPRFVSTAALVTNLAVHFEWGREASAVWVTRLDDGRPVSGAAIEIIDFCDGQSRWHGTTGANGVAAVDTTLGTPHGGSGCNPWAPAPLLVAASTASDLSITQSGWGQGIGPEQFGLGLGSGSAAEVHHTVFDRSLFRAGETVSMKHFLRRRRMQGFVVPVGAAGRRAVTITHAGSGQHYELETEFDAAGIATSEWTIPREARLGDYTVTIHVDGHARGQGCCVSGRFKVEQFRLRSMRASVTWPAEPLVRARSAEVDLHVAYLSGGGAGGIGVKLRALVEPRPLQFAGYADYQFGGKPVVEGTVTEANGAGDPDFEAAEAVEASGTLRTQVIPVTLDAAGSARVTIPNLPDLDGAAQLTAELEYTDANGELLTSSGRVRLVASELSVGIRREDWVASPEQVRFRVAVLNLAGKPQAGQDVSVALYQSQAYSYRKRLIGGFYAYETTRETHKLAAACAGRTDAQGLLACELAPGVSGEVIVRAETLDARGRRSGASTSLWVIDKDSWWFGGTTGDRMDVLPEKKSYEPGETARFQVRMPFRRATALVTVEREGVMSSFVTQLDARSPVIEVPVAGQYAPNVFISVLALRGRVPHAERRPAASLESGEITALVDLNRPAYRLGITEVQVGWKAHRLEVAVSAAHAVYKVRDQVPVRIHVTRADGAPLPEGTEVAVAAVDAALLELAPNDSWDLLKAMMGERGLEVWTSTAQTQVVGKRHYGRKAVPSGGGGGRERDRARELFESLLYWKARVRVDEHGDALVTVPLNDSLSEFRIVAVASGGAAMFGSGILPIRTTQDLVLLSGLPPLVREGDRFAATFTVRNTTDRALVVDLAAGRSPAPDAPLAAQRVQIPAGGAHDVSWLTTAPTGTQQLRWDVTARVTGDDALARSGDRLRISEAVIPAYPVRTYQATITQLAAPWSLAVQRPAGALPGRGGLEVTLRAHLGDGLDGVREYMSAYPYICLEQQVSRAVALRDKAGWESLMKRLPAYMDGDGLLKYFPSEWLPGDDSLTAYVLAIAQESGWELQPGDRDRLTGALRRFVSGRLVRRSALPTADLTIRKLAAIEALSRYGAADKSMLDSLTIEPNLWPTSAVIDWLGILRRVPDVPRAGARGAAALQVLRARLNFQGTLMGFSTERSDALWWLMISSDSNANRMLLEVLDRSDWREDIPRLVRGALGRQQSGHWNTTVANAWGVLAMEKFSAGFEAVPVSGTSTVRYGAESRPLAWTAASPSNELAFDWQARPGALEIRHGGTGRPWALVRARAALPLEHALSSGYHIRRLVAPVERQRPGAWTRGDVVRIRLELESLSDMSWVVVDDPVPAGATILGSGLGGDSALLARGERREGWAWPAFEERRFEGFRAYYRFVPKGRWVVEYTVRLNNPGVFLQPSTRVEAMYAPEMFGELPNAALTVEPQP